MDRPPTIPPRPPGYELRNTSAGAPPPPRQDQQQPQQQQQQQWYQHPQPQQQAHPYHSASPNQHPAHGPQGSGQPVAPAGFPPPPHQPAPPPSLWTEHLFYSNGRGTPLFEALMREFFVRLDPQGTGYITPEVYSSFLDVNYFSTDDNAWKSNLKSNSMYAAEDMADIELKTIFECYYIEHKVVVRNPSARQVPSGGMPLLSLAGFTDIMGIDYAESADVRLPGLNNALRHYRVWPEMGPVPRHVLPAATPPEVRKRMDEAAARIRQAVQDVVDASVLRARMQAQTSQNVIDLFDDYRYVRRY